MAKSTPPRGGPSRIRFVMVEADLYEGDLEQVTQVLQNAFRTTPNGAARPQLARSPSRLQPQVQNMEEDESSDFVGDDEIVDDIPVARPKSSRKAKPAKVPTILNDIDVKSDPSLKDFVAEYDAKTAVDKYLLIALWFRDARSINSVTVDSVYTCFKVLGWSTASTDFAKPLRNLRDEQSMTGDSKGYSLSLTGAGKIEAKKRSS